MNLFGDDDIVYDDDTDEEEISSQESDISAVVSSVDITPRNNPVVEGCLAQEKQFLDLFNKDSLPHAVIFSGPQGIGKSTFSFRLARFLFKHGNGNNDQDMLFGGDAIAKNAQSLDVDLDDPVFRRVASGGHADLLYIEREMNARNGKQDDHLKVDNLRQVNGFLRKTSADGGWRIVIVDDADTMNRAAQNAILKIMEEPPAKVMIILITHRIGMLIPTIRSRARVIDFKPLSQDIMQEMLHKRGFSLSSQEMERLTALSQGSLGQALKYLESDGLEMLSRLFIYLDVMPNWNWADIHKLSDELSGPQNDKNYRLFADLLQWAFRQLLFVKARGGNIPPSYLNHDALTEFMRSASLERLITICDDLKNHFERTDFSNLDRRDAVRGAFLVISQ